jgi:hypothetical protein
VIGFLSGGRLTADDADNADENRSEKLDLVDPILIRVICG